MSFKDFKNFIKNNSWKKAAVIATIVSAHQAQAMDDNHKNNDRKDVKTETVTRADNLEEKNLMGVAKVELVATDNGEIVPIINDNVVVNGLEPLKKLKKEYKKEQKEAFAEAESDGVEIVSVDEFGIFPAYGYYSSDYKNITRRVIEDDEISIRKYIKREELDSQQFSKIIESMQNENSLLSQNILAHEAQHKINDKANIYAPGLSAEQYGKLNCWDEISANVAMLALINHQYQKQIDKGISQEEALKIFDEPMADRFTFYKEALQNGLRPNSKDATKMIVKGTLKMWQETQQNKYNEQAKYIISTYSKQGNIASTLIGNDKDYRKRVEKIFDSIDENPQLKKRGVKIGNLSQYLPEQDIELSPILKKYAAKKTKEFTQLSPEQGKEISDRLPGSQKKDIKNLMKILTGCKTDENIPVVKDLPSQTKDNLYVQKHQTARYHGR